MCQLFETIKIEDGVICNQQLHDERFNRSRHDLFGLTDNVRLSDHISIPPEVSKGIVKCRVIYGPDIISVNFSPYIPADIKTLKIVDGGSIRYDYKFLDRSRLNALIDKSISDDVLIVKDGFLTEISFANIVFTDGSVWVTPENPLLRGTMRELLLRTGVISSERITPDNLTSFTHFRLINAMLGFNAPLLPITNILK